MKQIDGFKGVEDTQGRNHAVKIVFPMPASSKDIKIDETQVGPAAGKRATQKSMLQDFASSLYARLADPGLIILKTTNFEFYACF